MKQERMSEQAQNESPNQLPNVNLLPKIESHSNLSFYLFITLLSFTFIGFIASGYLYFTTNSKIADATEVIGEKDETITLMESQLATLESNDESLEQAVQFVEYYEIPTSILIKEVIDQLPDRSYLTELTYSYQETTLNTQFESLDVIANYTTNLLDSIYIADTKIDSVETMIIGDEEENLNDFTTMPRYHATFQLQLDNNELKGAKEDD